jgi:DNA repair ATPase RecN
MIKKYKIYDYQLGRYFGDDALFDDKKEVIDQLADYHDIDFDGVDNKDNKYKSINDFLATLKDDEERLNFLIDHGQWSLEEVNACDICGEEQDEDGRCACTNKDAN